MSKVFLFLSLTILLAPVFAQRPKIGLCLSGGGAKGMAHIGILKAIDKAGLKIDYITGTSMGSIIGAMYAAGYSAEQIEVIAGQLDWNKLLSGTPSYNDVRLYEKDEYGNYSFSIPFNKCKPVFNTGLIESEEIWLQFSEIFSPVRHITDFNQFNIPFKCIATDLSNGDAVVLDKGDIVFALRASMALPAVFPAIPYNDTQLIDGGIIRNFPVIDLKQMGADYVIGVNLFPGLSKAQDLKSVVDVMYQITNYRDAADLTKEKALCDLIIEPPLKNYTAGSFGDVDSIMAIGDKMGKLYYPLFKHLADSLHSLEAVDYSTEGRLPENKPLTIDRIEVEGLEHTSKDQVLSRLDISEGETYTATELSEIFRRAYAGLEYQYIYYQTEPTVGNHCILKCIVKENPSSHLNIGLSYHSFSNAAISVGYDWRNLVMNRSYNLVKFNISENWRVRLLHRQIFGSKSNHGLELAASSDRLDIPVYSGANQLYLFKGILNDVSLNYYHLLNNNSRIGIDAKYHYTSFAPSISTATLKGHLSRPSLSIYYHRNTFDRRYLPIKGTKTIFRISNGFKRSYSYHAESVSTFTDTNFNVTDPLITLSLKHSACQSISKKFTIFENLQAGYIENSKDLVFDNFIVGGIQELYSSQMNFVGLQDAQQHTSSLITFGLGGQYNLFGELYSIVRVNAGFINLGNPFKSGSFKAAKFLSGGGLSLAYYLSALPVEFSLMYSPEIDKMYTHISIGYVF